MYEVHISLLSTISFGLMWNYPGEQKPCVVQSSNKYMCKTAQQCMTREIIFRVAQLADHSPASTCEWWKFWKCVTSTSLITKAELGSTPARMHVESGIPNLEFRTVYNQPFLSQRWAHSHHCNWKYLRFELSIIMVDIRHRHRAVESTPQIPGTC